MKTRVIGLIIGALLFAMTPGVISGTTDSSFPRPNIVLLVIDDIPYVGDSFFDQQENIKDIFINHGLSFQNMDGNDPLCCPGRANILTAQYSNHNGVRRNDARLLDARETLATELKSAGYYSFIAGKYLNFTEKLANKFPQGWDHAAIQSGSYYNYKAYVDGQEEYHGSDAADYSIDVFANKAIQFLREAPADKPIFAYVSPYGIHFHKRQQFQPLPAPRHLDDSRCSANMRYKLANFDEANVSDKPAWIRGLPRLSSFYKGGFPVTNHCRTLLSIDEEVGRIADELRAQGRFDNTLWVMIGDNGMGWGSHRWMPKMSPFATGIPFYMSWPSVITNVPAQVTDQVTNVDLAPTLCELSGCRMGPYFNEYGQDGQSFAGLLYPSFSGSIPHRIGILSEHVSTSQIPRWRSIRTSPTNPLGRWHYTYYSTGEEELYDITGGPCLYWSVGMSGDPCELKNVANKAKYRALKRELRQQVDSLYNSMGTN